MSNLASSTAPTKEDPQTLLLRGRPQPAVRFRRGLIVGLTGSAAAALVTLSWLALEPTNFRRIDSPDTEVAAPAQDADALGNLPSSYGDVPRLGPPLPGDLGRPIVEQQRSLEAGLPSTSGHSGIEPAPMPAPMDLERQHLAAEASAARGSPVIVRLQGTSLRPEAPAAVDPLASLATDGAESLPSRPAAGQQRKIDFARPLGGTIDAHALQPPASPWLLSAGTIIPASLMTGLNSDLPGLVLAQVTENVRDSTTGRTILVPQGARLLGQYDSTVAYGQRRALVIWTRILFPDGWSIEIDKAPATDVSGRSGVADRVDSHSWQLLKGVVLSTLLGVGTQLSLGSSESDLVRAVRESTQQNAAQAGDQITRRNLDVQPTLTVRPGFPIRAILNKDLVLRPWRDW